MLLVRKSYLKAAVTLVVLSVTTGWIFAGPEGEAKKADAKPPVDDSKAIVEIQKQLAGQNHLPGYQSHLF